MFSRFLRPADTWLAVNAPRVAVAHAEHDRAEIFRVDRRLHVILGPQRLAGKRLDRALGLLASLVECLQIRADAT